MPNLSVSLNCIGIYTTFMYSKNNGLQERRAPSPA
jgi:hypothetical protein